MTLKKSKKILFKTYTSNSYHTKYYLYKEKGKEIKIPLSLSGIHSNSNTSCFAGLMQSLSGSKHNRLLIQLNPKWCNRNKMPVDSYIKKWIEIALEYKTLPINKFKYDLEKKYFILSLDKSYNPGLLYIYCNIIRIIQETPSVLYNTLQFINKHRMNYYVALVLSLYPEYHAHAMFHLHSINGLDYNIRMARGLNLFLKTPKKYQKTGIFGGSQFSCEDNVSKAYNGTFNIHIDNANHELVNEFIEKDEKELKNVIKLAIKEKVKVGIKKRY